MAAQYNSKAILALSDGTVFEGMSVGCDGYVCGEVVFNTSQTGYQEILTDPSYASQIIVFTQPHIGNVGVNFLDMESSKIQVKGVIVRSFSRISSSWRSENTLQNFLDTQGIMAVSEFDTRELTHHIRTFGSQTGCLMTGKINLDKALKYAKCFLGVPGNNLISEVTTQKPYYLKTNDSDRFHVVVYDFGVKHSILKILAEYACDITVVPANTTADEILNLHPDGIVLSNGPGDPRDCLYAVETTKNLLHARHPILGICFGHQLLGLACGATVKKMYFGHHGSNHPIQSIKTGLVKISTQNHGFVISDEGIPKNLEITHRSLFDGTIAGIKYLDTPAFGFQGHPESSPGPNDLLGLFADFIYLIECSNAEKRRY